MKVGIVSLYYNNTNYGGLLQAYALSYVIRTLGYDNEQLSIDAKLLFDDSVSRMDRFKQLSFSHKCHRIANYLKSKIKKKYYKLKTKPYLQVINQRNKAFKSFEINIPHSKVVYGRKNISESLTNYDCFIVGSDQVWNPDWIKSEYLLDFVPKLTPKFSYAASISHEKLSAEIQTLFKKAFSTFSAISIREKDAVELLKESTDLPIEWVLDPTLLLSLDEWNRICDDSLIHTDYVFCYYLSHNMDARTVASSFARENHMKIITLPFLSGRFHKCDANFGDERLFDVTPNEFLSLIKNAKYVFTDSFHATVFSHIYEKEYYVFNRDVNGRMSSRIYSLTTLLETQNRFCDTSAKQTLEYINGLSLIDYTRELKQFNIMKKKSIDFLIKNLKKAENKINE